MNIISFLYELLFSPKRKKRRMTNPELFHSDRFLRSDHSNYRVCPKCNVEAKTNKEAVDTFGLRVANGRSSIQSWCKNCRNDSKDSPILKSSNQEKIDL